jgi:hypothetical protein
MWHGYYVIENLGMTGNQKQQVDGELIKLGPVRDTKPCNLNHRRYRSDGNAVIYEAMFDEKEIAIEAMDKYLASALGIDPRSIKHSTRISKYGTEIAFTYNGSKSIMTLFDGSTWEESRKACLRYLYDYMSLWDVQ